MVYSHLEYYVTVKKNKMCKDELIQNNLHDPLLREKTRYGIV